jgi:hypothetical protein
MLQPVLDRRYPTEIILDVLFADRPYRDGFSKAIGQRRSEDRFAKEDAFAVMAKRSVPDICDMGLALIKPAMDGQIVSRFTAKQARRADGMMEGVSHDAP